MLARGLPRLRATAGSPRGFSASFYDDGLPEALTQTTGSLQWTSVGGADWTTGYTV